MQTRVLTNARIVVDHAEDAIATLFHVIVRANAAEHRRASQIRPRIMTETSVGHNINIHRLKGFVLKIGYVHLPVLHSAFVISHLAIQLEIVVQFDTFFLLLADGQCVIARGQCVHRIRIFF